MIKPKARAGAIEPRPEPRTMLERQLADMKSEEGAINPATSSVTVVGTTAVPSYPGSGLVDPVPPEEPLGYSVDDVPVMTRVER
jgi:hypothetical protein